ncbi:SDR family NAD(P)-dependent oxidoreductase, partial [Kutzneria sp. 744]|uniref:SDR family NAD(P)-dependent oxidoreductase n=1 Tax=Kutzneria sp. (strain 744) TaxID=345341 RepID=UPI0012F7E744
MDEAAVRRFAGAVTAGSGEDQISLRPNGTYGRRLARAPLSTDAKDWTPRGTVLVTGGTGGVGANIARRLAGRGAEHLVLMSRRGGTSEEVTRLREELGVRVTIAACDVADRDALAVVLADLPDLTAVVHAAGIGAHSPIAETDAAVFADALAGKAIGAANLDELLGDRPLDAFVLISSNAGVWGGGGQGAYAAANAYLDALAERRRSRGRVAT